MGVYQIQIAPWLFQKLKLKKLTYSNKQQAIEVLKEVLEENKFKFSVEDDGN